MPHSHRLLLFACSLSACGGGGTVDVDASPDTAMDANSDPSAKQLVTFGFTMANNPGLAADVNATIDGFSIRVNLPDDTDLSGLVASWTTTGDRLFIGSVAQVSAVTPNNFTHPVKYWVTALDDSSVQYTVTAALPANGFGAATSFSGRRPMGVALADIDEDGAPDVTTAETPTSTDYPLTVRMNLTASGATTPSVAAQGLGQLLGGPASTVIAADFNGDGKPDLVTNNGIDRFFVFVNITVPGTSTPMFTTQAPFQVELGSSSMGVADFNNDGRPDVVVASPSRDSVSVAINTTPMGAFTPSFDSHVEFAVGDGPGSIALADFDGDGKLDIATANGNKVSVLVNTTTTGATTPGFAPKFDITRPDLAEGVAAADIDGNGKSDLIVANGNYVSVLLNTTAAGSAPTFATGIEFATGLCPREIITPDIDADGRPDIVTVNNCPSTISALINITTSGASVPAFQAHSDVGTGPDPVALTFGDVNGDARVDVVVADGGNGSDQGGVSILLGL